MLEGLPAIDWVSLTHAYGPAGDIPTLFQELTSNDPEEWVGAISGLYDTLCHQMCTVYEATPQAIPFLIELLGYKKIRCRGRILQFLGDAARATSYLAAHGELPHFGERRKTAEFEEQLAKELEWVRRTREAIWKGLDTYLELLTDLDKRIRVLVPYTLGLLATHAQDEMPGAEGKKLVISLVDAFSMQLDEEPNELVRASLVFGLGLLSENGAAQQILRRLVGDPKESGQVRLAAAMSLAQSGKKLTKAAQAVLLNALKDCDTTNHLFDSDQPKMEDKHHPLYKAYRRSGHPISKTAGTGYDEDDVGEDEDFQFPWLDGGATAMILRALPKWGASCVDRLLPAVTVLIDKANAYTIENVAPPLLRLVFGDNKVTSKATRDDLTDAQAEVLQHIYDNPHVWATDIGNATSYFHKFGLSEKRTNWTKLLNIENKPLSPDEIIAFLARIAPEQQFGWEKSSIKRLNLREIGTPDFLPFLKEYKDLEELDLSSMKLKDKDLEHLLCFRRLKNLQIPGSLITDDGAKVLTKLSGLTRLNVWGAKLTDAGLKHLQGLPKLQELSLGKTAISEAALRRFKAARPKCRVW
jgi:hypothetical protein